MTTTTKGATMKPETKAIIDARDTLLAERDNLQVKVDALNVARAGVEARQREVERELAHARVEAARDVKGAAATVEALLTERAELATQLRTVGTNRLGGTMLAGELEEQRTALADALTANARETEKLYRDHTAALLAHAASFIDEADAKTNAALGHIAKAREAWGYARAELQPLSRHAGLGQPSEFPISVDGSTVMTIGGLPVNASTNLVRFRHTTGGGIRTVAAQSEDHRGLDLDSVWQQVDGPTYEGAA